METHDRGLECVTVVLVWIDDTASSSAESGPRSGKQAPASVRSITVRNITWVAWSGSPATVLGANSNPSTKEDKYCARPLATVGNGAVRLG